MVNFKNLVSSFNGISTKKVSVEEVHHEFLTASENLLIEFKKIIDDGVLGKADKLKKFGFINSNEVKKADVIIRDQGIVDLIKTYSISHPLHKVITKNQLLNICEKYNLIFGEVRRFTGFVPKKNVKEMENFKTIYTLEKWGIYKGGSKLISVIKFNDQDSAVSKKAELEKSITISSKGDIVDYKFMIATPKFMICAPKKDMIIESWETVKDSQIVNIPDPVVLYPIELNCYLIVTAWGDEASDPIVSNPKMN